MDGPKPFIRRTRSLATVPGESDSLVFLCQYSFAIKEVRMAEDKPPYHTLEDDTDLVRRESRRKPGISGCKRKRPGMGGTRRGYVSKNEIEDMTLFDDEPGKSPSGDGGTAAKPIDR